jgi:hypothetical protein
VEQDSVVDDHLLDVLIIVFVAIVAFDIVHVGTPWLRVTVYHNGWRLSVAVCR